MGKKKTTYYTVYLAATDELVATGSAEECARELKLTLDSFKCAVSRYRNGKRKKYVIVEDEEDTEI